MKSFRGPSSQGPLPYGDLIIATSLFSDGSTGPLHVTPMTNLMIAQTQHFYNLQTALDKISIKLSPRIFILLTNQIMYINYIL